MRRIVILLVLLIGLHSPSMSYIHANDIPEPPKYWVTDIPEVLSKKTKYQLNQYLDTYNKNTGHHIIVWIGNSTNGIPIEEWGVQTFASWKIGRKNIDDGVALFILFNDRKIRIEVGYGLEGKMPDLAASKIIQETIVPMLQNGNIDGAVISGVNNIIKTIGDYNSSDNYNIVNTNFNKKTNISYTKLIALIIIGIIILIIFIINPNLALFILFNIIFGNRSGGNYTNSRSEGGGRSGGGGASGSW